MGGRGAGDSIVTLVGGVVVLLQVPVRVDNQSTRTCQDTTSYRYCCRYRRNVVRRPFRSKGWSLRSESKLYSRGLAYLWRRPFLLRGSNGNAHRRSRNTCITLINWLSRNYGDANKPPPRAAPSGLGHLLP